MFIIVKSGIIDDATYQENQITGKETYEDEQVDIVLRRINVNHIVDYHAAYKSKSDTVINTIDGARIFVLEPLEVVEEKINKAALITIGN